MKNSIYIVILLFLASCNKIDYSEDPIDISSSGNAFVFKDAYLEYDKFDHIYDQGTYQKSVHYFTLNIDFYLMANKQFVPADNFPKLVYFHGESQADAYSGVEQDTSLTSPEITDNYVVNGGQKYHNVIVMNPIADKNRMYQAKTGFFLQQYIDEVAKNAVNNKVAIGYYNAQNNSYELSEPDLMAEFYERTANPNKNPLASFDLLNSQHFFEQLNFGIQSLEGSTANKQLTILTFSLFDSTSVNYDTLKYYRNLLHNKNITLNIISLLPIDFAKELMLEQEGFMSQDIDEISDINDFISSPNEFKDIISNKPFASNLALQNLDHLISGKKFHNRMQIHGTFSAFDSLLTKNEIENKLKKVMFKASFDISRHYYPTIIVTKARIK